MKRFRTVLILAFALGLAACEGENSGADQRTAVGQILPGSASDAMIPYDSLRSQPPLAPQTGAAGTGAAKGGDQGRNAPASAPDASDAAAAPAETPSSETPEPAAE